MPLAACKAAEDSSAQPLVVCVSWSANTLDPGATAGVKLALPGLTMRSPLASLAADMIAEPTPAHTTEGVSTRNSHCCGVHSRSHNVASDIASICL